MKKVLKTISLFLVLLIIVVLSACEFDTTSNPLFNKVYHFTHVDSKPATCTEDGNVDYWVCQETGKYYSEENGITEITNIVVPKLGHDMEHHEAKAATCTEDGNVEYWYCKREKKYYSDSLGNNEITNVVISKLGHDMTHVEAKAATCEEDGNVEYWHCNRDGKNYSDSLGNNEITNVVITKLGHDMTHVEAKAATCTEDGNVEYWYCNREGKYYSDALGNNELTNVVITKLGHDMTHVEAKAATYEEAGNIEYWHCNRDGKNYLDASGNEEVTNVIIPQLGRTITHTEAKAPTCEEDGNVEYWYCQEENKYYSDALGKNEITNIVISKLGHNYKLVANWSADGNCEYYLVCENDSNHKIENINGNITNTLDTATCEEAGVITYTLSFTYNGIDYTDSYTVTTEAKGHTLTAVNGLNPTAYEAGYKKYYSCDCGKYFEDSDAKVEILDLASWKTEGGNGYLAPLGYSATYTFTDKSFGATLEGVADTYFEASKDAFGFEAERGVQFLQTAGAIKVTSLYKYNNIRKIVIVASTAGSGNTKGEYKINILDKTFVQSIDKARQKNVELEYVLTESLSGGIELVITPSGGSCYIKSIQIYCESIGDKIHKHNYTYDVVWKGYEAYLVAACNDCTETEEGHIVETKLELDVEEQLPNCENDGLRTYTAKLPAGVENNNYVLVKEEVLEKLGHNYDFDHAVWAWADDLSSATFTVICSRCGEKTLNATVSHETTKKATEEENGVETYTAKVVFDGVEYKNEVTKPILYHTHEFEFVKFEWNEDKKKAYALLKCTYGKGTDDQCPKEEKHEVDFVLNETKSIKPTCENVGKNVYDVTYQNNNGTLEIELEALGHIYGDLIAEVPATCEQAGVKAHYECERCHELFIKDENDSYVKVSQADLVIEKLPHGTKQDVKVEFLASDFEGQGKSSYGDVVSLTINGVKVSSNKGYGTTQFRVYQDGILAIEGDLIKDVEFTFSGSYNGGLKEKYENIYGRILNYIVKSQARFTKITVTLADQYVLTHVEAKPATCEAEGNIEYWYCEACGAKFADALGETEISDVVIAKLPHNYDFDNIDWKWADDYSSVKVTISCLDCNHEAEFTLTSEASINGQIVEVNGVFTATFTYGNKEYTDVKDTNHVHSYKLVGWTWADDYLTATITFQCLDEKCKEVYTQTIDTTSEITVEPKCETKGTKKYSVSYEFENNEYSDSKEVEIEALGHNYKIYDEVKAKAEEAGIKEHIKCDRCGDIYLSYNQKETVADAFALTTSSNPITNKTLVGEIIKIVKVYTTNHVDLFILPLGFDESNKVECYKLVDGENLKEGDLIKVNGSMKNYKGTIEFDANCTFEMLEKVEEKDLTISPIGYEIIYKNEGNVEFDGSHEANYPLRHLVDEEVSLLGATKAHYTFVGWYDNPECTGNVITSIPTDVHNDVTLYAKWDIDKFSVTWKNEDGTILEEDAKVAYGTMPSYDGQTPAKASTAQYSYQFKEWDNELVEVTEDVIYIATYTETLRKYNITVTVNNDEFGTVSATEFKDVDYGTEIFVLEKEIYIGDEDDPSIVATESADTQEFDYSFVGFENLVDLTNTLVGDLEIVATFARTTKSYDVLFVLDNGVEAIDDQTVLYGEYVTFTVTLKTGFDKEPTFIVTANGVEIEPTEANGNEYKVLVTDGVIIVVDGVKLHGYQITYLDEDGTAFSETHEAGYPEAHIHGETTELKSATKTGYTFGGWQTRTGEGTTENPYVYTVVTEISADTNTEVTLYAKWTINKYTITFVSNNNEYGTVSVDKFEVVYNTEITNVSNTIINGNFDTIATATPVDATAQYTYSFVDFSGVVDKVTEDITITANFTRTVNKYTVLWENGNDILETDEDVEYGTMPSYDGEIPTKASTVQYDYQFSGWTPTVDVVTGDIEYVAVFDENTREYTIRFVDEDGTTELKVASYLYGTAAADIELPQTPTKDSTAQYTYQFDCWTPIIEEVTGDATYTAQYTETRIEYNITIVDNKNPLNEVLGTTTVSITKAIKDEKVTLTFTPETNNDGFINKVSEVTINGIDSTANIKNNELEFDMLEEDVTVNVVWAEYKGQDVSANVKFGNANGSIAINAASVVNAEKHISIETVYTEKSFTQHEDYSQVGSSKKPATSITITITLLKAINIKTISAKFGGFSDTAGAITLKVDEETIGTGNLNDDADVTIVNTKAAKGSTITITVTDISKGVKVYEVSYVGEADKISYPTVNFNALGGTTVSSVQVKEGQTISKPTNPTKDGYLFEGWYLSDDNGATLYADEFDFTTEITNDLVLYASWLDESAGTYTVKYINVYNGSSSEYVEEVVVGKLPTAPQPVRNGCTFVGWYESDDEGQNLFVDPYDFTQTKAKDTVVTLYTKWQENNYTVTLNPNYTGNNVNANGITVTYNSSDVTGFVAHTRVGYTLDGYYLEQNDPTTKVVNADGTLAADAQDYTDSTSKWINYSANSFVVYAKWTAIEYTIAFDSNSGSGSMLSLENKKIGESLTIENAFTAPEGKQFDGWALTADGTVLATDALSTLTETLINASVNGTITLYAKWKDASTATEKTVKYTFTSKSWDDDTESWTSGKDGGGFSNGGVQVTSNSNVTGANAITKSDINNVSKVIVTYVTNKSAGAGSIKIKIGDNAELTDEAGYSGPGDGRSTDRTVEFTYADVQSGKIKITVDCTTNSIYIRSITITYTE